MGLLKATLKLRILIQFHVSCGWWRMPGKREWIYIHINFICLICSTKCAFMPASISLQPNNQIRKLSSVGSAQRTLHHCGANSRHHHQSATGFCIQNRILLIIKSVKQKQIVNLSTLFAFLNGKWVLAMNGFGLLWPLLKFNAVPFNKCLKWWEMRIRSCGW